MPDEQPSPETLAGALDRLLAFRGQTATGATVDPLSKLTTDDLDVAIAALRARLATPTNRTN